MLPSQSEDRTFIDDRGELGLWNIFVKMQVLVLGSIFQFSNSEQTTVMISKALSLADTLRSSYSICMFLLMRNNPKSQGIAQMLWEPKACFTRTMNRNLMIKAGEDGIWENANILLIHLSHTSCQVFFIGNSILPWKSLAFSLHNLCCIFCFPPVFMEHLFKIF